MTKKSFKDLILVIIYQASGKWSWYQIEREVGWRKIGGHVNVVSVINQLINEGMVQQQEAMQKSINPVYWITNQGVERVQLLLERNGQEYYTQKEERPENYDYSK